MQVAAYSDLRTIMRTNSGNAPCGLTHHILRPKQTWILRLWMCAAMHVCGLGFWLKCAFEDSLTYRNAFW